MRSLRLMISAALVLGCAAAQEITKPESFFGYQLGADKKIARWDKLVEYYGVLEKQSGGRMKITNMGPTSEGNPFLMAIITSTANMGKLEHLREINARLSDPRGLSEAQARTMAEEARAVVVITNSMHATEIGGTQMAPELAYDLLARTDAEAKRILDNVIFILVPCFNPDGNIIVADWYNKQLGTPYEGSGPPVLYQKYAGHDNNRDGFQINLPDSKYIAKILFQDWKPESYLDFHHMGSYGARIFIPPYADPIRPFADPLVWREMQWYGAHMANLEEQAGLSGILNYGQYSGWGHFGWHWITPFHNIAGMLSESASARLASPIYISHDELVRGATARNYESAEASTIFPNPWPGGWWRLRDIVNRQKVAAWGLLDLSARDREVVVWNAYLKGKRQTERGAAAKPAAYVISTLQHDPLTFVKMINKLELQGLEIDRATKPFTLPGGMSYPAGTIIVPSAQPKTGLLRYLLARTFYIVNEYTMEKDGTPIRPYDRATDTMFEFMGVRVDPVDELGEVAVEKLTEPIQVAGKVTSGSAGYSMDGRLNDSFRALNILFEKGVAVRRVDKAQAGLRPGDFLIPAGSQAVLEPIAKQTGVDFRALNTAVTTGAHEMKRLRVGMYQRYGGGNMDEGWTRFVLEEFGFPYTSVFDKEIKAGNLNAKYDVFIFPSDATATITGIVSATEGGRGRGGGGRGEATPPEYRTAIGTEGIAAIRDFIQKGGTLVTFDGAANFAPDALGVGVRNVITAAIPTKSFWCPGSTLRMDFDNTNPIAYGMPSKGLAVHMQNTPAFEITGANQPDYKVVASYVDHELLESGWLIGEKYLAGKSAVMTAKMGQGTVVLLGFPIQHRAQTHGTYKLLFNTLVTR